MKKYKWLGFSIVLILTIFIYKYFNPLQNDFFPKCPLWSITGVKCPGCGSQRAVHHLLNFELISALKENLLIVFGLPYLLIGFILKKIENPSIKLIQLRKLFYGKRAMYLLFIIIIIYWIVRNVIHL